MKNEKGYQGIRGSGSGYQGIRRSGFGDWVIGGLGADSKYPNLPISKSRYPNFLISVLMLCLSFIYTAQPLQAADTTIKGTGATSATAGLEVTNSSDTSLLYVRNDGNVGIGTTAPVSLFSVGSTSQFQVNSFGYIVAGGADIGFKFGSAFSNVSFDSNIFGIAPTSSAQSWFMIGTNKTDTFGIQHLNQAFNSLAILKGGAWVGAWDKNGQMSIIPSNSSTFTDLTINPAIKTTGNLLDVQLNGSSKFLVRYDGNVGIGTTAPGYKLDINDNQIVSLNINSSAVDAALRLYTSAAGGQRSYLVGTGATSSGAGAGNFYIWDATAGAGRLIINSSGNVGIGTTGPSGILDVSSTTSAFLPPRMTTTQRDAIASPVAGMVIYNTTTNKLNVYTTTWEAVTSA